MTDTRRIIRRLRALRALAAAYAVLNVLVLARFVAEGSALLLVPAALIVACAVLIMMETRSLLIARAAVFVQPEVDLPPGFTLPSVALLPPVGGASMADVGLGMTRLASALGGCAHADAERVIPSGSTETVAWVCPDCDAGLPAGWSPPESSTGACGCRRCATGSQWWRVCERRGDGSGLA